MRPKANKLSSDILCLNSKYFSKWWPKEPQNVFEFIDKAKKYCSKIIWLDDSDSTSVTHFELLPEIDLYLKKQLLKDKASYTKPLYCDRLYTDFYNREYNISDETPYQSKPLDISLSNKVHLSWNLGLGDYAGDRLPRYLRYLRRYYLPVVYPKRLTYVDGPRNIDVLCRGNKYYAHKTISFHRQRFIDIIGSMKKLNVALHGFVDQSEYIKEIMNSKMVISPFGWGEICYKDFETWIYGSVLVKPDVSHMETWPDFYKPGETYIPIDWNFGNLEKSIYKLIENKELRMRLAVTGQETYAEMLSDEGMHAFCDWFIQQIEK